MPHDGDDVDETETLRAQIADLKTQRQQLLAEVERLREQRNEALIAANELQIENAALRRRLINEPEQSGDGE